jgi:hypothetical protein
VSLIGQYRVLHQGGNCFDGASLRKHLPDITKLVKETGAASLLDYGCGKAVCWRREQAADKFGIPNPTLYDPAVSGFNTKPEGQFDGVICTDVLEHVEDPEPVIAGLIGYATKFLFLAISCKPSKKKLPDGRSVHISVHPPEWWREKIKTDLRLELRFDEAG